MTRPAVYALLVLAMLASAMLGQAPSLRVADTLRTAPAELFRLDLDGDGKPDELLLWAAEHPDGPGLYDRVEFGLSRSGHRVISGSWDQVRATEHRQAGNLVSSRVLYVARFVRAGTLVFLAGEDVGCCAQAIDVYRVTARGISKYFESHEFIYTAPLKPSATAVTSLVGVRWMSEVVGTTAPGAVSALSYNPTVVIRLEERARLDTAASAIATRRATGGFAGVAFSEHVLMITARDSSRFLWDEQAQRRIP